MPPALLPLSAKEITIPDPNGSGIVYHGAIPSNQSQSPTMYENRSQNGKTIVNASLLRQYVDGHLDSAMQAKLAAFIEKNPKLQAQVEAMSEGGFLERVRAAHALAQAAPPSPLAEPPVHEAPEVLAPADASGDQPNWPTKVPQELRDFDSYEILKELGRGGMGVVYLAKNLKMGDRLEVLKVLNERLIAVPEAKERFLREISSVAKLNHPSIVVGYSVLPLPNLIVFAMEHVQGTDLSKFIRKNHPIPINVACLITQQIASGLQHGHERKLVHRDIKPSNIMIYKSGNRLSAKILDFGLAKASSEQVSDGLTQGGMMLGTLEYVAPEQMMDAARSDIRADIYSLGCTLYHTLSGRPPFTGTAHEIMLAHVQAEAPMVHMLRPDLPIELSAIVAKMMSKEAQRRFQSPIEIVNELKPFLGKPAKPTEQPVTPESIMVVDSGGEPAKDTLGVAAQANIDTSVDSAGSIIRPVTLLGLQTAEASIKRTARSTRAFAQRTKWISIAIATILLLGGSGLWLSGILTIKTENGTLVIENLPEDAEVTVDGSAAKVTWNEGRDTANLSIQAGTHQVEVKRGDLLVEGKKVTIVEGEKLSWSIQYQKDAIVPTEEIPELEPVLQIGDVFKGVWIAKKDDGTIGTSDLTITVKTRDKSTFSTEFYLPGVPLNWIFEGTVHSNRKITGELTALVGGGDHGIIGNNKIVCEYSPDHRNLTGSFFWTGTKTTAEFHASLEPADRSTSPKATEEMTIQYQETDDIASPGTADPSPPTQAAAIPQSTVFQVGDVYEGNWTNHASGETASDGTSLMTVTVTERNKDEVMTEWRLHTWDGLWQFKGKLYTNDDGSLLFRSTDAEKLNGTHVNEGNTEVVVELDPSGKKFKGKAIYKSGRRSEFNAKLVEPEEVETDAEPTNEVLEAKQLLAVGTNWEGTLEAKASFVDERKFQVTKAEIVKTASEGFILRTQTLHAIDGDWFSWEYRINGELDQLQIVEAKLIKKTASFSDNLGVREIRSSNVQLVDDELRIEIFRPIQGGEMHQRYTLKPSNSGMAKKREVIADTNSSPEAFTDSDVKSGSDTTFGSGHDNNNTTMKRMTPTIVRNNDGLPHLAKKPPNDKALRVLDLMPIIDVEKDALQGKWMRNGTTVISDDNHRARLRIPYHPPREYDYHVVFTRLSGNECVSLLASHSKHRFLFMLGGWQNTVGGFGNIAGSTDNNPTTFKSRRVLTSGEKFDVTVYVRDDRLTAAVNGYVVSDSVIDYSTTSVIPQIDIGPESVGLFTFYSPTIFHTIELAEISGQGRLRQ